MINPIENGANYQMPLSQHVKDGQQDEFSSTKSNRNATYHSIVIGESETSELRWTGWRRITWVEPGVVRENDRRVS